MDFTLYAFMFPVSVLVATCAMLSGIGGAALFTPIFVLLFPLLGADYVLGSTLAAIGTALLTQTFGFLSGFIGYYRRALIDYQLAFRLARLSVPVAIAGALAAGFVHDSILLGAYAALVAVLAVSLWREAGLVAPVHPAAASPARQQLMDSRGELYEYPRPRIGVREFSVTGLGAFLTGMVSVGIGEVTVSQLTRKGIPIAVAAATSVLIVILTVLAASTTLFWQLVQAGGWSLIPWNLLCYTIPGVLIGGQIGPRLQGHIAPQILRRSIGVLFVLLSIAMLAVAFNRLPTVG